MAAMARACSRDMKRQAKPYLRLGTIIVGIVVVLYCFQQRNSILNAHFVEEYRTPGGKNSVPLSESSSLWIKHGDYIQVRRLAFFDNRPAQPAIVINIMKCDRNRLWPHLHLKLVYSSAIEPLCVPIRVWRRSGVYKKNPGLLYINYVLRTTSAVYNYPPEYVMFTEDAHCKSGLSSEIPVYRNQNKKVEFGVCLHQPLYNHVATQDIVDWIVIHKIMGVELIYIYLQDVNHIPEAVEPFVKSGLVELIDWFFPAKTIHGGQLGVIHDCLYRSMHSVKYLALYDLDELLVPSKHKTWSHMLQEIEQSENLTNYASLSFQTHIWHDDGVPLNMTGFEMCSAVKKLPVYFRRTQRRISAQLSSPKVMLRPSVVESCWIHYILTSNPKVTSKYAVPLTFGSIHHFRRLYKHNKEILTEFDNRMFKFTHDYLTSISNIMVCAPH